MSVELNKINVLKKKIYRYEFIKNSYGSLYVTHQQKQGILWVCASL